MHGKTKVVDLTELKANVGGQMAVVSKLVEHIRESLPQSMARLRRAVEDGKAHEINRLAHGLKSPLGSFGAAKAHSLAREIELRAAGGDISRCLALMLSLEDEIKRIVDFFADPAWQDRV